MATQSDRKVVIVGGGIAGLAAAWSLRDDDVCVLEADGRVGGRLKSEVRDPYWLNLGAHILQDGGPMATLAAELGLSLVTPPGTFLATAMKGRIIRAGRAEAFFFRLPLSFAARLSLAQVGIRLILAGRQAESKRAQLEQTTFANLLGPMHPDVESLMRVIANRIGGELHEISGYAGQAGFHHLWLGMRVNIRGGSARLPEALHAALGSRTQTGARVICVTQLADCVEIEYELAGERRHMKALACVMAVPAPVARQLMSSLPPDLEEALGSVRYTPFVVAGIFTNETNPMPWDNLYALAVPGRSFCMLFNPSNALRDSRPRQPGGCLVVYAVAERAAQLLELSDAAIQDRYLTDLYDILPQTRGIVREVVIQRWPIGTFIGIPQRGKFREKLAARWGRTFFAGDYMMSLDGVDASQTGREAAHAVRAFLTHEGRIL